jgi:tetratricopeptide (TPR) repeat protein
MDPHKPKKTLSHQGGLSVMLYFRIISAFVLLSLTGCATVLTPGQEYAEGVRLFKSHQYAEAHSYALKAHNEVPDNRKYQSLLGWTYLKQGNLTEAKRLFSDLYDQDHHSLLSLQGLAWVEYSNGQLGQAKVWFQKELTRAKELADKSQNWLYYPGDKDFIVSCLSDANYGLGLVALAEQDYSNAQFYLLNALKYQNDFIGHDPIRAAYNESKGKNRRPEFAADFKQGKPSKASLEKLIMSDPYSADTPQVAKLIAQNPQWQPLQMEFAQAYFQRGDFQRAQEKLQAYLSHNGKDGEARIMDAWCDLYLGRLSLAFDKFNALSRKKKTSTQAILGRGVAEFYMRHFDKADADFKKVIAREPGNVRARVARGAVAFMRGNLPQAIKIYTPNLPYLPKKEPYFSWSSHALNNLGWSYIRTGQYPKALETFELLKNHHTRPIYPQAYDGLGWTYLYMGKNDKAQQAFQQSLRLVPGDVVAKNGLTKLAAAKK